MDYNRCRWLWYVVVIALGLCFLPGSVVLAEAVDPGFLDFGGARIGWGYSFGTQEVLTLATLPFNLHSWQADNLTIQLTADVVGAVPKLLDIRDATVGAGVGLALFNPENRAFKVGVSYDFERYGLVAGLATWSF